MATQKQKQIQRAIFGNIFWSVVAVGLLLSDTHGFWRVVVYFWLGVQLINLYSNISKYADAGRKAQHEAYEKTMNDFHKTMNDWARRTSQQQYSRQQGQQGYQDGYQQQQRQQTVVRSEMSITDAYKLMKLKYSDTPETVKKRYRQLAMLWHPDKFATDTKAKQEAANRNFQKLNSAYNVIKNHKKIV